MHNVISAGMNFHKIKSFLLLGYVGFARYYGKMYSCHLFSESCSQKSFSGIRPIYIIMERANTTLDFVLVDA